MARWVLAALLLSTAVFGEEICLSGDEEPYLMFGQKTAYEFASKGISTSRLHDIHGCRPVALWLLSRHGSHNPEPNELLDMMKLVDVKNNIVNNYKNGNIRNSNERICSADLNLIKNWEWNTRLNMTFAGDLTSAGYLTTEQLAQAWKARYPGIMTENRHDYMFKYANDKRSNTTFQAFTDGLFRAQVDGYGVPKENDEKLLRPYEACPRWKGEVGDNDETYKQLRMFESQLEFKQMISNISLRLGFNNDLDFPTVYSMYQMCRYSKAWTIDQISPWCAVFSKEELKRLEYAEDLDTYYKYGYGSEFNQKIGCSLIKEMIDLFNIHINNELPQQPRAVVHFAESPTVLLALTALGAHRDRVPLAAANYREMGSRYWTASTMAPFNANVASVLYRCETNNYQINEKYQVLLLVNEQEFTLEGCKLGLCNWSLIKNKFGELVERCDAGVCNTGSSTTFITFTLILTTLAACMA